MKDSNILRIIMMFIAVSASGQVHSGEARFTATVTRNLVDSTLYGKCMISIIPDPATLLPSCGADWVTFSCSGDFNSKSEGSLKFSNAQLAQVSSKPILLFVDDTKKHNGYCFAQRIDVINN